MTSENSPKIYCKTSTFPWQTMGEDTLIIEPKNQLSHEIVGVGSFIWEMIDGSQSLEDIVGRVYDVFEAPRDEIEKDVMSFVETLENKGLVHCQNQ